jgi:hypothetical protein
MANKEIGAGDGPVELKDVRKSLVGVRSDVLHLRNYVRERDFVQ